METTTRLTKNQVLSVYSGRDRACCCGCCGKHYYASATRDTAAKNRGYDIGDEEISDKMIAKVVRLINASPEVEAEQGHVALVIGTRLYIAYLTGGV